MPTKIGKRKLEEKNTDQPKLKRNERVREFKKPWQEGRGWLEYDEVIGMTCSACKKVGNPKAGKHIFN